MPQTDTANATMPHLDAGLLDAAVAFAAGNETPFPRDLRAHLESGYFEPAPDNAVIGPIRPRGAPNGLIIRHGNTVASWGDTRQVDPTFSVAKSYLSLLAGIAHMDGLIPDLDARVGDLVRDGGFEGRITARSPGGTCCSRPPNGRVRCSASPT